MRDDGPVVVDARSRAERRAREAWTGGPGPLLAAASFLYGAGVRGWSLLHETGILGGGLPALPVVSVGGVTVGGAGKTPLAAELAGVLEAGGIRTAVVTRGFPDELALHARLAPGRLVLGHPDRARAVREAAARGAAAAVLDDGFQHRRLDRRLDVVALDADLVGRVPWSLLPAGPFREPPGALGRAGAVVVTRREAGPEAAERLAGWVRRRLPGIPVARCALETDGLRPWTPTRRGDPEAGSAGAARGPVAGDRPGGAAAAAASPAVALAGVMKPGPFLDAVRASGLRPGLAVLLPDHGTPDAPLLERIVSAARGRGVVTTAKDAARLADVFPGDVPVLVVEERLTWEEGVDELRAALLAAVRGEPADGATTATAR